jgi:hypothetical protein
MSIKTYYGLIKDLSFPNVELVNFEYARILYSDSALAQDFVNRFNAIKDEIRQASDVDVKAEIVGRHNAIVLIDGLGLLYERNPEAFETVKNLIRRYTTTESTEGSVKQVLQVSKGRASRQTKAPAKKAPAKAAPKKAPKTVSRPAAKKAPKKAPKAAPTPPPASDGDGDIDGLSFASDIERMFAEHIAEEEVETCEVLITRAVERFSLSKEDAKANLDTWATKNADAGLVEYDPNYGDGEGLVRIL